MYFSDLNALYLHPGKTAGTSIENLLAPGRRDPRQCDHDLLFGWCPDRGIYLQHAAAATVRDELGAARFEDAYVFVTVRDPYARLVSVYHYLFPSHEKRFGGFKPFVMKLPILVKHPATLLGGHYTPQYLFATIDGNPVCDRVVRFESIDQGFGAVARDLKIDLELRNLYAYRHSSFPEGSLEEIYDDEMIAAMQEAYADDFRYFGFPDRPAGRIGGTGR